MVTLTVLALLSFASYRLTRLLVIDSIFEGTRSRFQTFLAGKDNFFGRKALDLVSCTWCVGIWVSLFLYSFYAVKYPTTFTRYDWITFLAVAGAQGLLHSWEPEE